MNIMPRWKKDETRFTVSVNVDRHVRVCSIPKPIVDLLGDPESLTFVVKNSKIAVDTG